MATVTPKPSYPNAGKVHCYSIVGLVRGANTITLPAPPLAGSFDPSGLETPSNIRPYARAIGAVGPTITPDYTTISNSSGTISFTLNSSGTGDCDVDVW